MKSEPTLKERIEGCLLGAAIGAELDWAAHVHPDPYRSVKRADELLALEPEPVSDEDGRAYLADAPYAQHGRYPLLTPLVDMGVKAYLHRSGRARPEDFAWALARDRAIADSNRSVWMLFYTTQELLGEGLNPRISGLGTVPSGLVAHAMPAVGIFHHNDPEYAYLDGVELASVCQPRLGADWAGMAAGAIAAAFGDDCDPAGIVQTVLGLAQANDEALYHELKYCTDATAGWFADDAMVPEQLDLWLSGYPSTQRETCPLAPNPMRFVLPLLGLLDRNPRLMMSMLLCPFSRKEPVGAAILAGAILGARHGAECFPEDWRRAAEATADAWQPMLGVVEQRRQREEALIEVHEKLAAETPGGLSLLEDRIYGCLLASSIGNAMGSPVESWSYEEVDAKYPDGISTILRPECLETEDDNQQMMLLLETYLAREGRPVMARHLAHTWCERWSHANLWPYCDRHSYALIRGGWDPRIAGHWNPMGTSVMCIEPVGLYHVADPDYAVVDASAIAYMHVRGLEIAATSILAAAVSEAVRPDATVDRVWDAALEVASHDWPFSVPNQLRRLDGHVFQDCREYLATCREVAEKYDDVFAVRRELYEKCLVDNWWQAAHLEIVGLPLAMLKVADGDVRQAAIGGTNIGRDADTNAGRAAMLAGALSGAGHVPQEWIQMFKPSVLERIQRSAHAMASFIAGKKLDRLRRRQVR